MNQEEGEFAEISDAAKQLVVSLLERDPEYRSSASAALGLPYFTSDSGTPLPSLRPNVEEAKRHHVFGVGHSKPDASFDEYLQLFRRNARMDSILSVQLASLSLPAEATAPTKKVSAEAAMQLNEVPTPSDISESTSTPPSPTSALSHNEVELSLG